MFYYVLFKNIKIYINIYIYISTEFPFFPMLSWIFPGGSYGFLEGPVLPVVAGAPRPFQSGCPTFPPDESGVLAEDGHVRNRDRKLSPADMG